MKRACADLPRRAALARMRALAAAMPLGRGLARVNGAWVLAT